MGDLVSSGLAQHQVNLTDRRQTADDVEGVIVHISNRLDKAGATLSQVRCSCPVS